MRRARWGAGLAALALAATLLAARAAETYSRFGYCAPPFPPPCADNNRMTPAELSRCEADGERYVASVFAYRGCLAAETERAVREANAAIRKLRCARDPNLCAEPAPQPESKAGRAKPARPE